MSRFSPCSCWPAYWPPLRSPLEWSSWFGSPPSRHRRRENSDLEWKWRDDETTTTTTTTTYQRWYKSADAKNLRVCADMHVLVQVAGHWEWCGLSAGLDWFWLAPSRSLLCSRLWTSSEAGSHDKSATTKLKLYPGVITRFFVRCGFIRQRIQKALWKSFRYQQVQSIVL